MKHLFYSILLLNILLVISCGEKQEKEPQNEEPKNKLEKQEAPESSQNVMINQEGVGDFKVGMSSEDFLAIAEKNYQVEKGPEEAVPTDMPEYNFSLKNDKDELVLGVIKAIDKDVIQHFHIFGSEFKTKEGVYAGMSLTELKEIAPEAEISLNMMQGGEIITIDKLYMLVKPDEAGATLGKYTSDNPMEAKPVKEYSKAGKISRIEFFGELSE